MAEARPDLRRVQGAASREKLLVAATELFAERGVAATGVDAVCRRAGVVKSALYWHFRSKQGLVAAVIERAGADWLEEIRTSVEQVGEPLERLDRFVAGLRRLVEERPQLLRLLLAASVESVEVGAETQEALRNVFARSRDAIEQGITDALGTALPKPERVAFLAIGMLIAIAVGVMLLPEEVGTEERFRHLRGVLLGEIVHQMEQAGISLATD